MSTTDLEQLLGSFEADFVGILTVVREKRSAGTYVPDAPFEVAHFGEIAQSIKQFLYWVNKKLPEESVVPLLLSCGQRLYENSEFITASKHFFGDAISRLSADDSANKTKSTVVERATWHGRALYGVALCRFELAKARDSTVKYPQTLVDLLTSLREIQQGMQLLVDMPESDHERIDWLVLNGVTHLFTICDPLITLGFSREVVDFLVWTVLCMESIVNLSAVQHLRWRVRLYVTIAHCYDQHGNLAAAESAVRRGREKVDQLRMEEEEDPPVPAESIEIFDAAHCDLSLLLFKCDIGEGDSLDKNALTAALDRHFPLPEMDSKGEDQQQEAERGEGQGGSGADEVNIVRLRALLETLVDANARTARAVSDPVASNLATLIANVCMEMLAPQQNDENAVADAADLSAVGGQCDSISLTAAPLPTIPLVLHVNLVTELFRVGQVQAFQTLHESAQQRLSTDAPGAVSAVDPQLDSDTVCALKQELQLLMALHDLRSWKAPSAPETVSPPATDGGQSVAATSEQATDQGAEAGSGEQGVAAAAVPPLAGEDEAGTSMKEGTKASGTLVNERSMPLHLMRKLADVLLACCRGQSNVVCKRRPDLVGDAALQLWDPYCRDLIDHVNDFGPDQSPGDEVATAVNEALWSVWTALSKVGCDDVILRATVALRAGHLLSDENISSNHSADLRRAVEVLSGACQFLDSARAEIVSHELHRPKSRDDVAALTWASITTDLNDTTAAAAKTRMGSSAITGTGVFGAGSELDPRDQALAALHADILVMHSRVELCLGQKLAQQFSTHRKRAASKRAAAAHKMSKAQGADAGKTVSLKDSTAAGGAPKPDNAPFDGEEEVAYCSNTEMRLQLAARKNSYHRAILLSSMACFRPPPPDLAGAVNERAEMLTEAISQLQSAQKKEDALLRAAQRAPNRSSSKVPPPPLMVSRTATTITLRPNFYVPTEAVSKRINGCVDHLMLYGKPAGAGTDVSLNNTEYNGTGVKIPYFSDPNFHPAPVTVRGLCPNDSYVFAVAAYDSDGNVIEGIGATCEPIEALNPLPLLLCWAYVAQTALELDCRAQAATAAGVLYRHFVDASNQQKSCDLSRGWVANPLDAHVLRQELLIRTSSIVLKVFVQSIFVLVDSAPDTFDVSEIAMAGRFENMQDPECKMLRIPAQIALLLTVRKMLIALEVAAAIKDHDLLLDAAWRTYHLLQPLLCQRQRGRYALQALSMLHHAIVIVPHQHWDDAIARMFACVSYQLTLQAKELIEAKTAQHTLLKSGHADDNAREAAAATDTADGDAQNPAEDNAEGAAGVTNDAAQSGGATPNETAAKYVAERTSLFELWCSLPEYGGDFSEQQLRDAAHLPDAAPKPPIDVGDAAQDPATAGASDDSGGGTVEDPLELSVALWPTLHRSMDEGWQLLQGHVDHPQYTTFVCRVCNAALGRGMWQKVRQWLDGLAVVKLTQLTPMAAAVVQRNLEDMEQRSIPLIEFGLEQDAEPTDAPPEGDADGEDAADADVDAVAAAAAVEVDPEDAMVWDQFEGAEPLGNAEFLSEDYVSTAEDRENLLWLSELDIIFGLSNYPRILGTNGGCFSAVGRADSEDSPQLSFLPNEGPAIDLNWELEEGHHNDDLDAGQVEDDRQQRRLRREEAEAERKRLAERKSWELDAAELDVDQPSAVATPADANALANDDEPENAAAITDSDGAEGEQPDVETADAEEATKTNTLVVVQEVLDCFSRAAVRARWAQSWMNMQTACVYMWNAIWASWISPKDFKKTKSNPWPPIESELVEWGEAVNESGADESFGLAWKPLVSAAVCLLDMLEALQADPPAEDDSSEDEIEDDGLFAGMGLETEMDEDAANNASQNSQPRELGMGMGLFVDVDWVIKFVTFTVQTLCYVREWQQLVEIGGRLNRLTNNASAEMVFPLVLHGQGQLLHLSVRKLRRKEADRDAFCAAFSRKQAKKKKKKTRLIVSEAVKTEDELQFDHDKDKLEAKVSQARVDSQLHEHRLKMLQRAEIEYRKAKSSALEALHLSRANLNQFLRDKHCDRFAQMDTETMEITGSSAKGKAESAAATTVVASYQATIDLLRDKRERSLLVMALQDLGDFYFAVDRVDKADKSWGDGVDALFNALDSFENWRELFKANGDASGLCRSSGVWGCFVGGLLLCKMAQFARDTDLHRRLEHSLMAAGLFSAPFSATFPHPQRLCDFTSYSAAELLPGVNILGDAQRLQPSSLMRALPYAASTLIDSDLELRALPLLCIYEHLSVANCADLRCTVDARLLRIVALAKSGYLAEAASVLASVLAGANLPKPTRPQARTSQRSASTVGDGVEQSEKDGGTEEGMAEGSGEAESRDSSFTCSGLPFYGFAPFHNHLPPDHPDNAAAIEWLCDSALNHPSDDGESSENDDNVRLPHAELSVAGLAPSLVDLYGPLLVHQLTLARSLLLLQLGQVEVFPSSFAGNDNAADDAENSVSTVHDTLRNSADALLTRLQNASLQPHADASGDDSVDATHMLGRLRMRSACKCLYMRSRLALLRGMFTLAHRLASMAMLLLTEQAQRQERGEAALLFTDSERESDSHWSLHIGTSFWLACRWQVATCDMARGRVDNALTHISAGIQEAADVRESVWSHRLKLLHAEALLQSGDLSAAERQCRALIAESLAQSARNQDYINALMSLAAIQRERALGCGGKAALKLLQEGRQLLTEAERVLLTLAHEAGWVGIHMPEMSTTGNGWIDADDAFHACGSTAPVDTTDTTTDSVRVNLYLPSVRMLVPIRFALSRSMVESMLATQGSGSVVVEVVRDGKVSTARSGAVNTKEETSDDQVLDDALEVAESALWTLRQVAQPLPSQRAALLLLTGRLRRMKLNEVGKYEAPPGALKRADPSPEQEGEICAVVDVELPTDHPIEVATRTLLGALHVSISRGGHDCDLMHSACMELVALFAATPLQDAESRHLQVACHYLRAAAAIAKCQYTLRTGVQSLGATDLTEASAEIVPAHISADLAEQKSAENSADESNVAGMARSMLYYYLALMQEKRICDTGTLSTRTATTMCQVHFFLRENFEPYRESCCLADLPKCPSGHPDIPSSLVCVQWTTAPSQPILDESAGGDSTRPLRPTMRMVLLLGSTPFAPGDKGSGRFVDATADLRKVDIDASEVRSLQRKASDLRYTIQKSADGVPLTADAQLIAYQEELRAVLRSAAALPPIVQRGTGFELPKLLDTEGNAVDVQPSIAALSNWSNVFDMSVGVDLCDEAMCYWLRDTFTTT